MKNLKISFVFALMILGNMRLQAQSKDTLVVTASMLNTNVLKEGTHRYLVYFKRNKEASRTLAQFWTRKVERKKYNGLEAIYIDQVWEDNDTIVHTTTSISDAKTMKPLYHKSWWNKRGSSTIDFLNKQLTINGQLVGDDEADPKRKASLESFKKALNTEVFNWHLDLEFFPILPYKKGAIFSIPFYEPASPTLPLYVTYQVTGEAELEGFDGQKIPCWLLYHEEKGNKELFWISKKTKEVLKLEQEVNGSMYRYKIKLGFSV